MDIYWIEEGETKQRKGPLPVVEIVSMLEREDLTPDVKGWHRGCEKWGPLSDLPMLQPYFEKKAREEAALHALINKDEAQEETLPDAPVSVRIFVTPPLGLRFWARLFDCTLYFLLYFATVRFFTDQFNILLFYPWLWFPMILLEACSLSLWGTTPGKFLMGIQVRYCKGSKLNFLRALHRSFATLFFGCGMMTFPFFPICSLFSWWYIRKNRISVWDRQLGSVVEMKNGGKNMVPGIFFRALVLVLLLLVMVEVAGGLIEVWQTDLKNNFMILL